MISELWSDVRYPARVVLSGECFRSKGRVVHSIRG